MTLNELRDAEDSVEGAEKAYLRAQGWTYTCELGSVWLWKKQIGERVVMVNTSSARMIEELKDDDDDDEEGDDGLAE